MPRTPARSILIVDDDTIFRERLVRAFRDRGYRVCSAGNYDEAVTLIEDDVPDLLVADLRMPGHSGLELVKHVRGRSPLSKIVVLTGYASIATAMEAVRLGATHYLPKPADVDDIIQAFSRGDQSVPARADIVSPSLDRAEWEHIQRVLADCGGNISEAARRLGLYRRSLQRKMQRHLQAAKGKPHSDSN